ncbi:MAG: peptidoglycan/LPS O-acetylase OafA/YrhL [Alphaproteobacteria bacterium]|jgi:peptidoglycan/LPS O-acetylase OafA/YrhL
MQFRKDINGLRAIAVIAVVLFHFNASWISGGFAGVDVFFVISGFLMTGIIFRGIEQGNFSILKFYVARANRIIPALAALCLALFIWGWFYLTPYDYKALGKHIASSMFFLSNIAYWKEAGYFDAASHEKWLLHSWSLSAEWQFYIIYPLILVGIRKFMSVKALKLMVLLGVILGFMLCVVVTYKAPNPAYYLLPTRAWEMMIGGVAYLYPFAIAEKRKKFLEWSGLLLIIASYFLISKENPWPGYLAFFPVLGSFFIIQAGRNNSFVTGNFIFQKLGAWSYSIYLWHWPLVVAIYYFSLNDVFIYIGIALSILLGFLSNRYIETLKFPNNFHSLFSYFKCKPIYMVLILSAIGMITHFESGFLKRFPDQYQSLVENATQSPYRNKCHIDTYQNPQKACEYFGDTISWAVFGDSHATEIAYALAQKLKPHNIGIKHLSFSGCKPSYQESNNFSKCAKWYNESVQYLLDNQQIQNIVFNHRFTKALFKGNAVNYPNHTNQDVISDDITDIVNNMDIMIKRLASQKENIYIFYPIPELPRNINQLIGFAFSNQKSLNAIKGTDLAWYQKRNAYMINHFDNANYPANVHLLKPQDVFCDTQNCYATRDNVPLYFDNNHPSVLGSQRLVDLIKIEGK